MKTCRFILIPAFFFLLSLVCIAQDKQQVYIDSLLNKLPKAKEDTNKVNLFAAILVAHNYFKPEEGLKNEKPALELAEKINWKIGVAKIKYATGRIHWRMGNFEEALKNHFEALRIFTEAGDDNSSAYVLLALGQDYADGGRYPQALIYLSKALRKYEEIGDKSGMSVVYNVLAWVYGSQGNYAASSKNNYESLRMYEQLGDKHGIAIATSNLADDYKNLGNYTEALKYSLRSIKLLQEFNDRVNIGAGYNSTGEIYKILGNYPEAIKNHLIALKTGRETNDIAIIAYSNKGIGEVYLAIGKYTEALNYYLMAVDLFKSISNNQELASLYSKTGICYTYLKKYDEARKYYNASLSLSKELNSSLPFIDYYHGKELLDSVTGNWKSAYRNYKQYIIIRDSAFNKENINKVISTQMQYDAEKKDAAQKAEQLKKDIRQRNIRNSIAAGLSGALVFLVVVYRQRNKIKEGKRKSDDLLLNILPEEVAEELKAKGSAEAKQFDEVTVMFTDFKGFSRISEKLTPAELVAEIHNCFKAFDEIISKHNIEKIKTIGDAYMCAGGLPVSNETHATDIVKAALEILQFMQQHLDQRKKEGKDVFEIRIGVHTGPVVAGIVGVKKFAYDIWGDTVNIASRMESSSEAGKLNISGSTYELVKDKYNCIHRGKIPVKNKGEIDMYFVNSSLSES